VVRLAVVAGHRPLDTLCPSAVLIYLVIFTIIFITPSIVSVFALAVIDFVLGWWLVDIKHDLVVVFIFGAPLHIVISGGCFVDGINNSGSWRTRYPHWGWVHKAKCLIGVLLSMVEAWPLKPAADAGPSMME
jgi:hypothetical protein